MSATTVLVEVELPRLVYLRLRTLTAKGGQSVTDMLTQHAYRLAHITNERDALIELYAEGLTDAEIARTMAWTNRRVALERRELGLIPNKRRTTQPKGKTA